MFNKMDDYYMILYYIIVIIITVSKDRRSRTGVLNYQSIMQRKVVKQAIPCDWLSVGTSHNYLRQRDLRGGVWGIFFRGMGV